MFSDIEIEKLNSQFETEKPEAILRWAWSTFHLKVAATSSFQSQSMPLLHMISQTVPELPILFLDTGFHFPQTLTFRDRVAQEYGLKVQNLKSEVKMKSSKITQSNLYHTNPDLCCYVNKVKPLQDAKLNLKAWITGIRRDQTQARSNVSIISLDQDGLYKICPMATWSRKDIWNYSHEHKLPEHPMLAQGYLSIGCAPCTRPIFDGETDRDGRWSGQDKVECGIHITLPVQQENGDK